VRSGAWDDVGWFFSGVLRAAIAEVLMGAISF